MAKRKAKRPSGRKPAVRKLATKCTCGKLGYTEQHYAMQAVISGGFARAGVRTYQCETSGLWHTTSMRHVPPHAQRDPDPPTPYDASPIDGLTDQERELIAAVRRARQLRIKRTADPSAVSGDDVGQATNAATKLLAAAVRTQPH